MKEEPKKREFFDSLVKTFAPLAYVNASGNELALEPEVACLFISRVLPLMMTVSSETGNGIGQGHHGSPAADEGVGPPDRGLDCL